MANWRVAKSLLTLRDEVNALAPHRHTGDDGTIGDARHQAEHSDHNPDSEGVVRALDITHDPPNGCDCAAILGAIVNARDERVSYLIFNRKIYNPKIQDWAGRPYNGEDPHTGHLHVSVVRDDTKADNTRPWSLNIQPTPTPAPIPPATGHAKAGVYGWFDGSHHWEDDGDKAGSAALQVPDSQQGHAFYSRYTLGKWFYLTDPHGKTVLSQQTDIGPSPWTGRGIDIHARVADALEYTQADFPTNSSWSWSSASPPPGTEHLSPKEQAAAYHAIQFITSIPMPDPTTLPAPTSPPPGLDPNVTALLQLATQWFHKQLDQPPPPPPPPAPQGTDMGAALATFFTWFISVLPQVSTALAPVFAALVQADVIGAPGATTTGTSIGASLLSMLGVGILNWLKPQSGGAK